MFTSWLVLIVVLRAVYGVNLNDGPKCFFASRTRSKENCYGHLSVCYYNLARAAGVPEQSTICVYHKNKIVTTDRRRCSCPSSWGHSKSLHQHPIPKNMHTILDEAGKTVEGYRSGTRWCNKCQQNAKLVLCVTPTNRRKVRNITAIRRTYVEHESFLFSMQTQSNKIVV